MAEVVEEAEGQVVVAEEVVRIEVVKVKRVVKDPDQVRGRGRATPGTRLPGMQTCLHLNHASGTGPMGSLLIFVLSLGHVLGSNFSLHLQTINEVPTSSN